MQRAFALARVYRHRPRQQPAAVAVAAHRHEPVAPQQRQAQAGRPRAAACELASAVRAVHRAVVQVDPIAADDEPLADPAHAVLGAARRAERQEGLARADPLPADAVAADGELGVDRAVDPLAIDPRHAKVEPLVEVDRHPVELRLRLVALVALEHELWVGPVHEVVALAARHLATAGVEAPEGDVAVQGRVAQHGLVGVRAQGDSGVGVVVGPAHAVRRVRDPHAVALAAPEQHPAARQLGQRAVAAVLPVEGLEPLFGVGVGRILDDRGAFAVEAADVQDVVVAVALDGHLAQVRLLPVHAVGGGGVAEQRHVARNGQGRAAGRSDRDALLVAAGAGQIPASEHAALVVVQRGAVDRHVRLPRRVAVQHRIVRMPARLMDPPVQPLHPRELAVVYEQMSHGT